MIKTSLGAIDFDLLQEITRVEDRFKLPIIKENGKRYKKPTIEMLSALRDFLEHHFKKTVSCFQAWQVWMAAYAMQSKERKRNVHRADVTFWYGINANDLSDEQLTGLHANIDRVKAQGTLHDQKFDPADYKSVYALVMLATDNEELAIDARAQSMEALINLRAKSKK